MTLTLAAIWRHPIKAHGRESLASVTLAAGRTLPWDRSWAVRHQAGSAEPYRWSPCRNFSRAAGLPGLMAISGGFDEVTGRITLRHPDRPDIAFHPDRDAGRFLDWVAPLTPPGRPAPDALVRAGEQGMTDTGFASISIASLASLRALGDRLGQRLAPERFRANLWIDGTAPWSEFDWIGRSLRIGGAVLEVRERITRCRATEADPATGRRDADTLRALSEGWGHKDFGLYAVVTRGGGIATGDAVTLA